MSEAAEHPHNIARGAFATVDGVVQPSPAPRFSRTPTPPAAAPSAHGADADRLLDWGVSSAEVAALRESGAIR